MTSEERAAWLKSLKEGDPVVAVAFTYCQTPYLRRVEKVTEDEILVDDTAYSRQSGSYDGIYCGGMLEPAMEEQTWSLEKFQRRIDQAYECAGLARQDGDMQDAERWMKEVERLRGLKKEMHG